MAKLKAGKHQYSEKELEKMFAVAEKRGRETLKSDSRAKKAHYDARNKRLVIELVNGCVFMIPTRMLQGLNGATTSELANIKLMPFGLALNWVDLNVQHSLSSLLSGSFGNTRWMSEVAKLMGRKGGSVKSELKAKSSRENGMRGGRPTRRVA